MSDTKLDIERDKYLEWKDQQKEAMRSTCEKMERLEAGRYIEVYGFDWRDPEWGEYGQVEIASNEGIIYSVDPCA